MIGDGTFHGGTSTTVISPRDISDGLSNTIMVVEADADRAVEWTRPKDLNFDSDARCPGSAVCGRVDFRALFADGPCDHRQHDRPRGLAGAHDHRRREAISLPHKARAASSLSPRRGVGQSGAMVARRRF